VAGTHYTAQSGTLTFAIGQASASIAVPILSNGPGDGIRTVNLTLSNPSPTPSSRGPDRGAGDREGPAYTSSSSPTRRGVPGFSGVPAINENGAVAFKAFLSDERSASCGATQRAHDHRTTSERRAHRLRPAHSRSTAPAG